MSFQTHTVPPFCSLCPTTFHNRHSHWCLRHHRLATSTLLNLYCLLSATRLRLKSLTSLLVLGSLDKWFVVVLLWGLLVIRFCLIIVGFVWMIDCGLE